MPKSGTTGWRKAGLSAIIGTGGVYPEGSFVELTKVAQPPSDWSRVATAEPRRAKPVKWWALVGAAFLLVELYVFTRWLASGPTRTPVGPSPVPGWMKVTLRSWEVSGLFATAGCLYWFVFRPWRRDGRLSFDGMLVLCLGLAYWQDPSPSYFTYASFNYNSYLVNFGSWAEYIPGWLAPNGQSYAEPILWAGPTYVYTLIVAVLGATVLMRRLQRRWPTMGKPGLIASAYACIVVFDVVVELAMTRVGAFTYPGAIKGLTFFHGHYYQFPVYEAVLWGGGWTALACLRYFRDDKGRTVVERTIDEVKATPRQKAALRFLALVGVTQIIFLSYNVSFAWFGLHGDSWPEDIQQRSYFTNGLVGPGTDYAPPGPGTPTPRRSSSHVAPDGRVVVPGDDGR